MRTARTLGQYSPVWLSPSVSKRLMLIIIKKRTLDELNNVYKNVSSTSTGSFTCSLRLFALHLKTECLSHKEILTCTSVTFLFWFISRNCWRDVFVHSWAKNRIMKPDLQKRRNKSDLWLEEKDYLHVLSYLCFYHSYLGLQHLWPEILLKDIWYFNTFLFKLAYL